MNDMKTSSAATLPAACGMQSAKLQNDRETLRIGLYGGTFDPPHIGHVRLAEAFYNEIKPARFYIVPDYLPPHKALADKSASAEQRCEMCRIAFDGIGEVSSWETDQHRTSYTVETVSHFSRLFPGSEILLLVGDDMISTFTRWYKYQEILRSCTLVAADRSGIGAEALDKLCRTLELEERDAKIIRLRAEPIVVSSSQIRQNCAEGTGLAGLVTDGVAKYITENGLYE